MSHNPHEYIPDKWAIIKIEDNGARYKVLAGWSGGYLGADSWRISSGIKEVNEKSGEWEIINHSGSVYSCRKHSEGFTVYSGGIFEQMQVSGAVSHISIEQLIKELE